MAEQLFKPTTNNAVHQHFLRWTVTKVYLYEVEILDIREICAHENVYVKYSLILSSKENGLFSLCFPLMHCFFSPISPHFVQCTFTCPSFTLPLFNNYIMTVTDMRHMTSTLKKIKKVPFFMEYLNNFSNITLGDKILIRFRY